MGTLASGSIDLKSLKVAGEGASKYITEITSDGIFISPSSQNPVESAEGNSVKINGDGLNIYKGGASVARYGDTARVGLEESSHLSILGNSISGIASNGIEYFEVSENGGSKTTTSYTNIFSSTAYIQPTISVDLSSTTTSAKGVWLNITTGSSFHIKIEYFCRTAQAASVRYASRSYEFVKGTTLSTAYVNYNGVNTITIHEYPSPPSGALRFIGCRVYLGWNQTVALPFYRFGEDVAESGSGYSFLTGRGTKSTNSTWPQLVTGRYNNSYSNAFFIVGNGTSDSARSNAFCVSDSGISINDKYVSDFVTEKGQSGDWHYEKWASGKVDAYFYGRLTGSTPTQTNTYYYRSSDNSFTIPSGIFPDTPTCVGTNIDSSNTVMFGFSIKMTSATTGTWQVFRTNNNAVSFPAGAHFVYMPENY